MKFLNNLALFLLLLWQIFGLSHQASLAMTKWEWEYALRIKVLASVEEKMKELALDQTQGKGSSRQQLAALDQLKHRLMRGLHFSLSGLVQEERDTLLLQLKQALERYPQQWMYYRETEVLMTILQRI